MNCFSTTLLDVVNDNFNNMLTLLDMHTSAPTWPKSWGSDIVKFDYTPSLTKPVYTTDKETDNDKYIKFQNENLFKEIVSTICEDLISYKDYLNEVSF